MTSGSQQSQQEGTQPARPHAAPKYPAQRPPEQAAAWRVLASLAAWLCAACTAPAQSESWPDGATSDGGVADGAVADAAAGYDFVTGKDLGAGGADGLLTDAAAADSAAADSATADGATADSATADGATADGAPADSDVADVGAADSAAQDAAIQDTGAADVPLTDVPSSDTLPGDTAPSDAAVSDVASGPDCGAAPKLCPTTFTYPGNGSEASVELRGSFNGWKTGIALAAAGTDWTVTTPMPYGQGVEYKFRIVKNGGGEVWVTDPGNPLQVTDPGGNTNSLLAAQACQPWTCGKLTTVCGVEAKADAFDWRAGVMYFVFVDRFVDGNPANNGTQGGIAPIADWHGGDWAGVTQKIQDGYFTALGVNVLWLTVPLDATDSIEYGDGGHQFTGYHGYWPRDRNATNSHFGSMADLQALVSAAHQKGIQIVLDYAMNHVHKSSPVWQQHASDGWFHGQQVNGQDCTCGSGVCPWEGPSMLYCWFTTYLPDFNFQNADARKASIDNVIWWLQQSGADGLRLDAIKHVEAAWLTELRQRLLTDVEPAKQQHVWLVGETYSGDQTFLKTFVDPCTKLDGQFDFAERATIDSVILVRSGKMQDLEGFLNSNDGFFGADAIMSTFIGNHDLPRSIHLAEDTPVWSNVWDAGKDKAWSNQPGQPAGASAYERMAVAMAVILTNPGVPLLYYGDEIGLAGAGDPDNRRPMQWTGYNSGQQALLAKLQALGQVRKNHPALRQGTRKTLWINQDAWVYQRTFGQDTVVVALNRGDSAVPVSNLPAGTWQDALGGPALSGGAASIPARGVRVWVK